MARPVKIPAHLHARLAELDLCGWSSVQIQSWLATTYQIDAAVETICKVLRRVRITPPVDDASGGLTDFIAARAALRADLLATDWRARQGAVARLVEIRRLELEIEERRSARLAELNTAPTKTYTVDANPDTWPDQQPEPAGTPETPETQPEPAGGAQ